MVSSTPLSSLELLDQAIQMASPDLDQNPSPKDEYDPYISHVWVINNPRNHGLLDQTFSFDEAILGVMNISE